MSTISRRSAMVGAALALTLVASGCSKASTDSDSKDAGATGAGSKPLNVVFIPKNLGNPYFDASDAGGKAAVEALGGKFSEVGPQTASPDAQVQYINTAAQQKASAIVISANDPTAIGSALQQAKSTGTKVVTFDSDTEAQFRDLFINQASPEGIAKAEVDGIAKQIGDAGEIAILSASANATNQNAWIKLMKAELAASHPNITLVETVYGNDDDQTSFDKTAALLNKHPKLRASSARPRSASRPRPATSPPRTRRGRWP